MIQRVERPHHRCVQTIHDHVASGLRGSLDAGRKRPVAQPRRPGGIVAVPRPRRPQATTERRLRAARRRGDLRTERARLQDRGGPHPAGAGVDQDPLARPQGRLDRQVRERRQVRFGEGGRLDVREAVGGGEQHAGGHRDALGVAAAGQQRVHPVARPPPGGGRGVEHLAGHLEAEDGAGAGRGRVAARALRQVGAVDAGGAHPHERLPRPRVGVGHRAPGERSRGAVDRLHARGLPRIAGPSPAGTRDGGGPGAVACAP